MTTNNKTTDSNTNTGDTGAAAAKNGTTASSKAAARKKQQQLKNHKTNPPAKKKQQHVARNLFEGISSGVNPMKGIVIAQGNGNQSGQFNVFQKKLVGAAAGDKAYGLDLAILELKAKVRSDFITQARSKCPLHTKPSNGEWCGYRWQHVNMFRSGFKRADGRRI
jgi:hypothetical protein